MIISDNMLQVPGKIYKVKVKCISTRRPTTIEWLILNCTKKFGGDTSQGDRTLKYVFEKVFQFQNSELLIKPCLRSLRNINVIQIEGGDAFDYDLLRFTDIKLTELGITMLKEGLLPGEPREISMDIYFNPLTGKISNYNNSIMGKKDVIEFGTESDYSDDFPEETIKTALQVGSIGSGRFTASKFKIEEIDRLTAMDWASIISISVHADDDGTLTTVPTIIADGLKNRLQDLVITKEIGKKLINTLPESRELHIRNIIGSGKTLKSEFLNICKNGRILFIDSTYFNVFKRNTASFKNKTLILYNDKSGFSVENNNMVIIRISDNFPITGCAVLNDKGEHVSFCKKEYMYEGTSLSVPLAVQDERLIADSGIAPRWLESIAMQNLSIDIKYSALFTLPVLIKSLPKAQSMLYKKWEMLDWTEVFNNLKTIYETCTLLGTEMFGLEEYLNSLLAQIDFSNNKESLQKITQLLSFDIIKNNKELHSKISRYVMENITEPSDYAELYSILHVLGIVSHDDALQYDDYVGGLYSKAVVKDIIIAIADNKYTKLPEFFELDVFFNDYAECLAQVENHVSGLRLFEHSDCNTIIKSVRACPDLAALQSFVAELKSKNSALMSKGVNVYDVLRKSDAEKAEAFTQNLGTIETAINNAINEVYKEQEDIERKGNANVEELPKKKIYIVDTCAMIHNPELFLYFSDEEYIRIPTKVLDELGKIKDKRNSKYSPELSDTARGLAHNIEYKYLRIFNKTNPLRLLVENASLDLLPKDLDPTVPDNQILSVALKYKDWECYIISDDGVFRLTSLAQKIHPLTSGDFISNHKEYYKSLTDRIKDFNKSEGAKYQDIPEGKKQSTSEISKPTAEKDVANSDKNDAMIDALPISDIRKYGPWLSQQEIEFLKTNKIKTIGEFRDLTESRVNGMKAKGRNTIYRNAIANAVRHKEGIFNKIRSTITENTDLSGVE